MILLLAGTTEGRQTAVELQRHGYNIIASVATEYGAKLLCWAGIKKITCGRLMGADWLNLFKKYQIKLVVDATHPFAVEVSRQAMASCLAADVPYWRLERPSLPLPSSELIYAEPSLARGIETAFRLGKKCFCALGSKHLPDLIPKANLYGAKIIARVLPTPEVLTYCKNLGLRDQEIISDQGPFSTQKNIQHYLASDADVILTKESGINGGFKEKIAAAIALNLPIVVWQRPILPYPRVITTLDELLKMIEKNTVLKEWGDQKGEN